MNHPRCPKCGEQIQATREMQQYLSLVDGVWVECSELGENEEIRYYCANDHELEPDRDGFPEIGGDDGKIPQQLLKHELEKGGAS